MPDPTPPRRIAAVCVVLGALLAVLAAASAAALPSRAGTASESAAPQRQDQGPSASPSALLVAETDPCDGDYQVYRSCWEDNFAQLVVSDGIEVALQAVHDLGERFPQVVQNCHEYKHKIGRASAQVVPDPRDALAFDDRACQYGYRHGVLEAFATTATEAELRTTVSGLCEMFAGSVLDYPECLHAVGHAAAVFEPADVVRAVSFCDEVPGNDADANACAGGVLMEYGNSYILDKTGVGAAEPHGPGEAEIDDATADQLCTLLPERYGPECWLRINMFWGPDYQDDFESMFERCRSEAGTHAPLCARSLGEWVHRQAAVAAGPGVGTGDIEARRTAAEATVAMCSAGGEGLTGECLYGALTPLRRNFLWEKRPESEWVDVCGLAPISEQSRCQDAMDDAATSVENATSEADRART